MYAVIRTGGKQYRVAPGDTIRVEKLEQELGSKLDLTEVLMVGGENPVIGNPLVKNAKVHLVITRQDKDPKVIVFKKKRRQGYRRLKGHRQLFTELFVQSIVLDGNKVEAETEPKIVDVVARRQERAESKKAQATTPAKEKRPVKKATKARVAKKSVSKKAAGAKKKKTNTGKKKKA